MVIKCFVVRLRPPVRYSATHGAGVFLVVAAKTQSHSLLFPKPSDSCFFVFKKVSSKNREMKKKMGIVWERREGGGGGGGGGAKVVD